MIQKLLTYRWKLKAERRKNRELRAEVERLGEELGMTRKAHIRATQAWFEADERLEKLGQVTVAQQLLGDRLT